MSHAVLVAAYSHGSKTVRGGLSYHLVCNALAVAKASARHNVQVAVASTVAEDVPGLWDRLRQSFPASSLFELTDEDAALGVAASRLLDRVDRIVIHVQGMRQLQAVLPLRKQNRNRVHIVYTLHSFRHRESLVRRAPYCLAAAWRLRRHVDYTFFLTPSAIHEFVGSSFVLRGGRAGIVPLGVANWADWMTREPEQGELDERLRCALSSADTLSMIYLAAFKPGKGHMWLIRSAAPVLQAHRHVRLILAGWGDESIRDRVADYAQSHAIANQVLIPGAVRRDLVPWILNRCHCGLAVASSETFGQVITESMAAGLPVVCTRSGVGAQIVLDYQTGFSLSYGDTNGLTEAIDYLVTHPDDARMMGERARTLVTDVYDWDEIGAAQMRVYLRLLER